MTIRSGDHRGLSLARWLNTTQKTITNPRNWSRRFRSFQSRIRRISTARTIAAEIQLHCQPARLCPRPGKAPSHSTHEPGFAALECAPGLY